MLDMERRAIDSSELELRAADDGSKTVEGYAIKWDTLSVPLGWFTKFREKFKRGAFAEYLKADTDTKFLIGHNINTVLGRRKNQTLELTEDDVGLRFKLTLPATTLGNDTYESIRRGDVDKISLGFNKLGDEWDEADENNIIRTVTKANLPEISLTAWPAYEDTEATARDNDPYQRRQKPYNRVSNLKKLLQLQEMEG